MEEAWIRWADADFPMPPEKRIGIGVTFNPLPVNMKALMVSFGRVSKPVIASCAAANTLLTLIARSFSKVSREMEYGLLFGAPLEAMQKSVMTRILC